MADHVFGNRSLGDLNSEFEQFAVDPRRTQRGFSRLIVLMRSRVSFGTWGRPDRP
jgi:hypothetical protein